MIPRGVHFFGHGHKHDQHDWFDFDYCYTSFKTCFDYMELWGLQPKSYGYPASSGRNKTTQLACELAGFISNRKATPQGADTIPALAGERMSVRK
jgi:hypothetical protein